jgi:hypothetical protein
MTDARPSIRPSVDDAAERWVSFADLAAQRGISRAAASKLVRRHGWRRQTDNQGRVLILVPETALDRRAVRPSPSNDAMTDRPTVDADVSHIAEGALAALEDAVSGLRDQLEVANARAERAEADRSDERLRADDLRDRLIMMQQQLADAHVALQEAEVSDARSERAEAEIDAERAKADALRERVDDLQAGQQLMMDMHARALAAVQSDLDMTRAQATTAHDALKAVRQAQAERKGRGLLARLRAAVRGE